MSDLLFNPQHWLDRAEEARSVADQLTDPTAREMMFEIVATYERLARDAERRLVQQVRKS